MFRFAKVTVIRMLFICAASFLIASPAFAQTSNDPQGIVPDLNVPIPGLTFTAPENGGNPLLAQYLSAAYGYIISISAIAATVMFVYGAFLFLLGGAMTSIKSGKTIMTDAIVGMLLVLGANTILRTVNPDLVKLRSLYVEPIKPYSDYEGALPTGGSIGTYVKPQAICSGSDCKQYCDGCGVQLPLPNAPWIPSPEELTPVAVSDGLIIAGKNKQLLRKEAAEALAKAGKAAQNAPGGPYTLQLGEAYRPLKNQMAATCQFLCGATQKHFAAPGASLHGTGIAVDVSLWKDSAALVTPQGSLTAQATNISEQNAHALQQIMASAGWVQYCPEIWHYEYGVPEGGEKSKHCPWPPPTPR